MYYVGVVFCLVCVLFFFFKQKTAYEMRISDWSSDVCSSDLAHWEASRVSTILAVTPLLSIAAVTLVNGFWPTLIRPEHVTWLGFTGARSEERRVGKECVSRCRSRWSPYHYKKKNNIRS